MKQERDANDALDWDAALAGIDIIVSGLLDASDDFLDAKVHRLIERLLD
jgi:hypothetical protein